VEGKPKPTEEDFFVGFVLSSIGHGPAEVTQQKLANFHENLANFHQCVVVFINDILVYLKSTEEHEEHL
jgi:hypothetical protein